MNTIDRHSKNAGVLRVQLIAPTLEKIREMPGRKKWQGRDLVFELSAGNIEYLQREFPTVVWSTDMLSEARRIAEIRRQEDVQRSAKRITLPPEARRFPFKTKPYQHQEDAFFLSRDSHAYALLFEMGTGKTKVILDTAAHLYGEGQIDALLVWAPNGVHKQWIEEQIPVHLPDWCPYVAAYYASNTNKAERVAMEQVWDDKHRQRLRILAMNIEAMSSDRGKAYAKKFAMAYRCLGTVDESTRIKTPGAARTRAMLSMRDMLPYRRIMSGAPVTKGVEDLYAQFAFLDADILGFNSFYTFRNRYCIMGGFEMRQIVSYRHVEDLQKRIDGWSYRVTKEQCLDLPPKVPVVRKVELHPEQKRLYDELKDEFLAQIGDRIIDAPLAITRLMRMQQVVCGHLPAGEDQEGYVRIPAEGVNPRIECAIDAVREAQGQKIVWARFRADLDMLAEALTKANITFTEYHGGNAKTRDAGKRLYQQGKVEVFLGQTGAGGTGHDLPMTSFMLYYSNDFNADTRWQSEDRGHRIGNQGLTIMDLVSCPLDAKILAALQKKKNVADLVVDAKMVQEMV